MTRLLLIIAIIAVLAAGSAWVMDHPGNVTIEFEGTVAHTSFAALALIVGSLMILSALTMRLWRWVRRGYWERRTLSQHRRGYNELAWGLSALMAGDGKRAQKHARKFESLVGKTPLADVLAGEAAMMQGELADARTRFQALEGDRKTEALALRGLLAVAGRSGDEKDVLSTAKAAVDKLPKADWAQSGLFEAATTSGNWEDAANALSAAMRSKTLDSEEGRRQLATVRFCQARDITREPTAGATGNARAVELVKEALDLNPDLIPARSLAANLALKDGHKRRAASILKTGWQRNPHPSLAEAWLSLEPDNSMALAYQRLETLTKSNPDHPESHMALAEAAFRAELYGPARRHANALIALASQARAFRLLAAIEEAAYHEDAAASARVSLLGADDDPAWHCNHCGHTEENWTERCSDCGAFAPLGWTTLSLSVNPPAKLSTAKRPSATSALMAEPSQPNSHSG